MGPTPFSSQSLAASRWIAVLVTSVLFQERLGGWHLGKPHAEFNITRSGSPEWAVSSFYGHVSYFNVCKLKKNYFNISIEILRLYYEIKLLFFLNS